MSVRQGSNLIAIGNVQVDGDTVSFNQNHSLQAKGVINKNESQTATQKLYDWVGTLQEYQDQYIERDHPEWICYITDDHEAEAYEAYSKTQSDSRYYQKSEVNSLLNTKVDLDASNFNDGGKAFLAGLGRFSNRFEQLIPVHGSSYTAPANGFFVLDAILANATGNRLYLLLRNGNQYAYNNKAASMAFGAWANYRQYIWIPVSTGDKVSITMESTNPAPDFNLRFFYADGCPTISPTYAEVEYIEGQNSVQYIKSGIIPSSDMKVYCKVQNTGTGAFICGARNVTFDGLQMNVNSSNNNIVIDYFGASTADRWTVSTTVTANDIFELTIENNVGTLKRNGTVIGNNTFTPSATISRELYLTGFNNNGALGSAGATGRLYAFKLWDSDNNLILDMIPAKDGSGVACLYNRATDTLYYNQGTGTYTTGPEIDPYTYLEYIQSTGTQYIDTGVTGNNDTVIELQADITIGSQATGVYGSRIYGTTASSLNDAFHLYQLYTNNNMQVGYDTTSTNVTVVPGLHTYLADKNSFKVDGTTLYTFTSSTFTTPSSILLFSCHTGSDGSTVDTRRMVGKVYSFKIYNNNALVRNLVPARRELDNAVGMYDTVTDQFFGNAGTGTFIEGPEV